MGDTDIRRITLLVALLVAVATLSQFSLSSGPGPNSRNYSVDAKVNISGSPPVITLVTLPASVTLNAGGTTDINCSVNIRDYNGGSDVPSGGGVNATLFTSPAAEGSADDNNTHYTNSSCAVTGGPSSYYVNYTCTFRVNYYANNGTWTCLARANDSKNIETNASNTTTINALYALNVTPLLDYGEVNSSMTVGNITANITNLGNRPINISVEGYGNVSGDNLSFVCEFGNLSVDTQHFAANNTANFAGKQALNSTFKQVYNLVVNKTNGTSPATNSTWWELYIDPNQGAAGGCNGTIVFQAEA